MITRRTSFAGTCKLSAEPSLLWMHWPVLPSPVRRARQAPACALLPCHQRYSFVQQKQRWHWQSAARTRQPFHQQQRPISNSEWGTTLKRWHTVLPKIQKGKAPMVASLAWQYACILLHDTYGTSCIVWTPCCCFGAGEWRRRDQKRRLLLSLHRRRHRGWGHGLCSGLLRIVVRVSTYVGFLLRRQMRVSLLKTASASCCNTERSALLRGTFFGHGRKNSRFW